MKKTLSKIVMFMTASAMTLAFAACSDSSVLDDISVAEIDLDRTDVGQLKAESDVISFNLKTDADAEWKATVEWDEDENDQPAYVYPKEGKGSAILKIATLTNITDQVRHATLKISFPKDESKNISVPLTQQRAVIVNGEAQVNGDRARAVGYGYNAFLGYCDQICVKAPILAVQQMYEEDELIYDFSKLEVSHREESGASVEELARKLNTSAHVSAEFNGFSGSVDAQFNIGQKSSASNEFAWMDINVRSARASLNGSQDDIILERMLDEAYANINGMPKIVRGKERISYPSTPEGFRKLVLSYGTHLVIGGVLGGQVRTSVVANTSKINTAYNASVALTAAYNSDWANLDINATAKAQQASAVSSNHSGFFFSASARGGGRDDGTISRLNAILDKMSEARQGTGTEDDLTDDSDMKVVIEDNSKEYKDAYAEWKEAFVPTGASEEEHFAVLKNLVHIDFSNDADLVPLYELVDRGATEDEDGFDGEARYQAFKLWYETELMRDPEILKQRPNLGSYITVPPTKIDPMPDLTKATSSESLIQDIYLANGQHVARICSEFIPIINPSKRVNVIYPIVNGKPRYNQGIFCGDEASYPAQVSWGYDENPSEPIVTTMKGYEKGLRSVAYLRGNHLTLEPDSKFSDSEYLTTKAQPYVLKAGQNTYNTVKINDFIYTRDLWAGETFANGTSYRQASSDFKPGNNCSYYRVKTYSRYQKAFGGFAPQGWTIPYVTQYQKMIDMLIAISGNKPDGSIGGSFVRNGVYGFTIDKTGFYLADNETPGSIKNYTVCNNDFVYFGCLADEDITFWDDVVNDSKNNSETDRRCPALVVSADAGTATLAWWSSATNNHVKVVQWDKNTWKNPDGKDPDGYLVPDAVYTDTHRRGYYVYMPVILCQKAVK